MKGRSDFNPRKNFNSSAQSSGSGSFYETPEVTKNFNDRLDYLLVNSIGSNVVVTSTSGIQFEGVLSACNLESTNGIDVILKNARIVDNGITKEVKDLTDKIEETLLIQGDDVAEIDLKNIDFNLEEQWENSKKLEEEKKQEEEKKKADAAANKASAGVASRSPSGTPAEGKKTFQTDVDISRSKEIKQRELQKWTPDDDETFKMGAGSLEDDDGKWDQFAVNEKKFGIKSSFDEHFYTTKINKEDPNYAERLKEAERIAKEIESQGTSGNVHIAEDRGIILDDSGMDEEDLYSGVDRRGDELLASLKSNSKPIAPKPRRYVPPTLRNQPHHMDPAILSSTGTKVASPVTKHSAGLSSKKESKQKKQPNSKEAQIEELRKFSEKFKVPYEMPKEMQDLKKTSTSSAAPISEKASSSDANASENTTELDATEKPSAHTEDKSSNDAKSPTEQSQQKPVEQPTLTKKNTSNLKADPSLPPKPVNKTPNAKVSLPPTPSTSKTELKKGPQSSTATTSSPQNTTQNIAPGLSRPASSRRRNAGSFFGNKKILPKDDVKQSFARNFNMFLKSKEAFDKKQAEKAKAVTEDNKGNEGTAPSAVTEQFFIEKPYFTAPTWTSTVEKSYKDFFPDGRMAIQKAQARLQKRQMGGMGAGMMGSHGPGVMSPHMGMAMGGGMGRGNMGGFPMAPMAGGAAPTMINGFGGMYMPFQPQPVFYPGMVPMMGGGSTAGTPGRGNNGSGEEGPSGSMSPQAMSPHIPPAYMNGAPMGYPPPAPFHGMMGTGMNDRSHGNYYNNHNHRNNHNHNYHHQK